MKLPFLLNVQAKKGIRELLPYFLPVFNIAVLSRDLHKFTCWWSALKNHCFNSRHIRSNLMFKFDFFFKKKDLSASHSLLNTQRDMEASSWNLMSSWREAEGGGMGEVEQRKLGVPTRTIYSHWSWTTTWGNAHDVTSGEKCRTQGDVSMGQGQGRAKWDQSNIKYVGMWIKTQRRLRKIKIVYLGLLNYIYIYYLILHSYTVVCVCLFFLINMKLKKVGRKKGGKEYLS